MAKPAKPSDQGRDRSVLCVSYVLALAHIRQKKKIMILATSVTVQELAAGPKRNHSVECRTTKQSISSSEK